jgi:hypothetical protein
MSRLNTNTQQGKQAVTFSRFETTKVLVKISVTRYQTRSMSPYGAKAIKSSWIPTATKPSPVEPIKNLLALGSLLVLRSTLFNYSLYRALENIVELAAKVRKE